MLIKEKLLITLITVILVSSLTLFSCLGKEVIQDEQKEDDPCIEVEERNPRNVIEAEQVYYDEDILFEDSDLIFKGKVIDEKEIGIEEYINGELVRTYYEDVSTFEIKEIYYSEDPSLEAGDVVKVGNASCSYWWVEGTLKMEKDKEYIVLAIKKSDMPNVEFTKCYDYYTTHYWVSIIRVENGDYFVDEELTSLITGEKMVIIRKDGSFETAVYVKGEEFESDLEDLILKKKEES